MVSKLAAGIIVVIVVVGGGAAAYVLTRPSEAPETYTLTTSVGPSGSGSVSPSSGTYDVGTSVPLTATPASGYSFSHWGGDASGTSTSVTITMNSDKDVTAYFTTIPTYELFYDYEVDEYYNYETTTTTSSTYDNTQTEISSTSTYSMQVTGVEDDEITCTHTTILKENSTEWGPEREPYPPEDVEITMKYTGTNKGEMISWEIENVVPSEYWENMELHENSQMAWSQLFQTIYVFPEEPVSIGQEWEKSIEEEIPWGPGMYMELTGEGSAHLVGQENVVVEAGTFDCWRIDYDMSVSGELELTYDNVYAYSVDTTLEGTTWYSKQNCAEIKSTMSMTMSTELDNVSKRESLSESVTELVEYGTI
jgi:hypothetical protein